MSTRELIDQALSELSETQQREVYDFVRLLRGRADDASLKGLAMSESALKKDWNTPQKDAAWRLRTPRLAERSQAGDFVKHVTELPADAAL